MTTIRFYEKPGCINNTRQKKLLTQAGYGVEGRNLLTESWSREQLENYFNGMSVAERFNRSAPMISSGQVLPEQLDEDEAYRLMLKEPLLIRRPLMQIGEHYLVGFEPEKVNQVLALSWDEPETGSLESCPHNTGEACDESEET
jgi:nitrogenase-associated protein